MSKKGNIVVWSCAILIIVFAIFFIIPIIGGNVENVRKTIGQSKVYTEKDIENAIKVVTKNFNSNFKGCKLKDIWYDEEVSVTSASEWARQYKADEAIILLSNFDVDSEGGDGSLNPNSTYTNWNWILVRNNGDKNWKLETWGY